METPWGTGVVGVSYQQLPDRVCAGENLQGQIKESLCPGAQLLFLSGSVGLLPYRGNAGGDWELEF